MLLRWFMVIDQQCKTSDFKKKTGPVCEPKIQLNIILLWVESRNGNPAHLLIICLRLTFLSSRSRVIPLQSIIRILPCSFHWHSHPPSDPPHMPPHHVQVKAHSLFYELKNTLYGQKYSLFCLHIHMYLSEIPFLIHKVCCDVSPPFVEQL